MNNMEDRYLFICETELQIIAMLNLLDANQNWDVKVDVVLSQRVANEKTYINLNKLKDLGVLDDVFYSKQFSIDAPARPYLKNYFRSEKVRKSVNFITSLFYTINIGREKYLDSKLKTFGKDFNNRLKKYKRVYYSGYKSPIVNCCDKNNCEFHAIDEGLGSYLDSNFTGRVDHVHLYEPDLVCYSAKFRSTCELHRLRKLSIDRKQLLNWISIVFDLNNHKPVQYRGKLVYFDQPLGDKDLNEKRREKQQAIRRKLIIWSAKFAESKGLDFLVRTHPGARKNIVDDKLKVDRPNGIPFELDVLYGQGENLPDCCVTISSGAAFYWRFLLSLKGDVDILILQSLFNDLTPDIDKSSNNVMFFRNLNEQMNIKIVEMDSKILSELKE